MFFGRSMEPRLRRGTHRADGEGLVHRAVVGHLPAARRGPRRPRGVLQELDDLGFLEGKCHENLEDD